MTIAAVLLLRREIKILLPLIRRLKAGPVEAEFEREILELQKSEPRSLPGPKAQTEDTPELAHLLRLAEVSPRAAITEAWRDLELSLERSASQVALASPATSSPSSGPLGAVKTLVSAGRLTTEQLVRFGELRALRNRAVHAENFTPNLEAAVGFIELARRMKLFAGAGEAGG